MQKRGLSTIIITLILIVVSLVAVAIFWVVVRNLLQTGTEGIGLGRYTLSANIKNVNLDNSTNNVSLTVERNPGQGEISGVEFIFSDGTDSEVVKETVSMKELESRKFYFHLTKLNVSNLKSISIAFLIKENDKETLGDIVDKYNVGEGGGGGSTGGGTCSPSSCTSLGYECGNWGNGTCLGTLNCGTCGTGQTCNANGICQTGSCTPTTCSALGHNCGSGYVNGTCAGTLNCGTCSGSQTCVNGTCQTPACTPTTCSTLGYNCGSGYANGTCAGTLNCGTCPTGQNCVGGSCVLQTGVTCEATGGHRCWYVDNSAAGSNNGSDWNNAWTNFSNINWASVSPGDFIYISGGSTSKTYTQTLTVGKSGTSGLPITIKKAIDSGHSGIVTIDCQSVRGNGIVISSKDYVTVNGFNIMNCLGGEGGGNSGQISTRNSNGGIIIENCVMRDYCHGHAAIFDQYSSSWTARNNTITTCNDSLAPTTAQLDGIYKQYGVGAIIENNWFGIYSDVDSSSAHNDFVQLFRETGFTLKNNYGEQINIKTGNAQGFYATACNGTNRIYNNVLYNPHGNSVIGYRNLDSFMGNGTIEIYSNTLIGGGYALITITDAPDPIIKNNILNSGGSLGNYAMKIYDWSGTPSNIDYNLIYSPNTSSPIYLNSVDTTWSSWIGLGFDAHGMNVPPLFINTATHDFHLQSGSPAINKGTSLSSYFTIDKDGISRPQGSAWDIGAYEYR